MATCVKAEAHYSSGYDKRDKPDVHEPAMKSRAFSVQATERVTGEGKGWVSNKNDAESNRQEHIDTKTTKQALWVSLGGGENVDERRTYGREQSAKRKQASQQSKTSVPLFTVGDGFHIRPYAYLATSGTGSCSPLPVMRSFENAESNAISSCTAQSHHTKT